MPDENYSEIVKFTWDIQDVETKAQAMIAKAGEVSTAIMKITTDSAAMDIALAKGFDAGIARADVLILKLQEINRLQGDGGSSPAPRRRGGGGGGGGGGSDFVPSGVDVGYDVGAYHITPTGQVQLQAGKRFVAKANVPQEVADMADEIAAAAVARARTQIVDRINPNGGSGTGAFNPNFPLLHGPSEGRASLVSRGSDFVSQPQLPAPQGPITYDLNSLNSPEKLPPFPPEWGPNPQLNPALGSSASRSLMLGGEGGELSRDQIEALKGLRQFISENQPGATGGLAASYRDQENEKLIAIQMKMYEVLDRKLALSGGAPDPRTITIQDFMGFQEKNQRLLADVLSRMPIASPAVEGFPVFKGTRGPVDPGFEVWRQQNLRLLEYERNPKVLQGPPEMEFKGVRGNISGDARMWQANNQRLLKSQSWLPDPGDDSVARNAMAAQLLIPLSEIEQRLLKSKTWLPDPGSDEVARASFARSLGAPATAGGAIPLGLPWPTAPIGATPYAGYTPPAGYLPPPAYVPGGGYVPPGMVGGPPPGGGGGMGGGMAGAFGGAFPGISGGPYFDQVMGQQALGWRTGRGNALWNAGRYDDFESFMEGPGNNIRRTALMANSNVRQFESGYDFNALPSPTAKGTAYDRFYKGQKVQDLGVQLENAQLKGNEADVNRLNKEIDETKKSLGGASGEGDKFNNVLGRIAARVVVFTAIFEAFRIGAQVIRDMVDESLRLEDVSARVGFINGQSPAATGFQFQQAAAYGISPEQAGPGIISGAQLGATSEDMENASKSAMVFGPDTYNNALNEIIQTRLRAQSLGTTEISQLDFIATAYKNVANSTGSAAAAYEIYSDSLQQGYQLAGQFGTSVQAMGLAIAHTSMVTEQGPEQTSTLYQSILSKLGNKDTQKRLKPFGIEEGDPNDMIRQINGVVGQLQSRGNRQEDIQKLMEAVQGGGLGSYARVRQMTIAFDDIGKAIDNVNPKLEDFEKGLAGISETGVTKINQLTAAWHVFLATVADTSVFKGTLTGITDVITAATSMLASGPIWSSMSPDEQKATLKKFEDQTGAKTTTTNFLGLESVRPHVVVTDEMRAAAGGAGGVAQLAADSVLNKFILEENFKKENADRLSTSGNAYDYMMGGNNLPGGAKVPGGDVDIDAAGFGEPGPDFGGFQTFSKGMNWDAFVASTRKYEGQIDGLGGYELDQKQYQYYDESTGLFRSLLADSNAIRFATEEQRKLMAQAFTGTFNVPSGGRIPFAALLAGFGPAGKGSGASAGGLSDTASTQGVMGYINAHQANTAAWVSAAQTMSAAAQGILGYLQAHGAVGPGSNPPDQAVPTASASGVMGYINAHAGKTLPPGFSNRVDGWNTFAPQSQYRPNPYGIPSKFGKEGASYGGKSGGGQVNVVNNIRVNIDGRQVAAVQNRQTYRQFDSVRNSTGAPNTLVSV